MDESPDFGRLDAVLRRRPTSGRVPFYDLFSSVELAVLRALGQTPIDSAALPQGQRFEADLRNHIKYMTILGYDHIDVWDGVLGFSFAGPAKPQALTQQGRRGYVTSEVLSITGREDFERYPWPDPARVQYDRLEHIARLLPAGMKMIVQSRGILETTMDLLGHQQICLLLYDDPALVRDVFDAVGQRFLEFHRRAASHPAVGAMTYCDDMGFKTQTLLPPQTYRELLFPWHRRIVESAHRHDKPAILHACGNLREVMEDIIACGWDAKQSFEDAIEPIWEAKAAYGGRIGLLGGFDMDKLCRMTVAQVRAHTRLLIEKCAPGGGWALGTGNSVPNYVPIENLLAMLDEGRQAAQR